ncbi:hypothetical protein NVP1271B_67 [Vibrio phage 1.271.B._10N.286.54.B4]|nr:hypothetical protein NVP1027O_67 [Vibrio phage 1.027.O._10N.286.54.B8]AUR94447.1 hypothetical protein NVP1194O_67 [Vibrio phage 1.194.O._10N.286.54.B1]AUR94535.1 hypothetical protein NVP1195O_70 [Vibrio phage 1.195.O._10N.286.54.C8]AUR94620.1 hypothetical protein NVP1196O_67 [Vibrio phage 1.196.O._10N.286.54.E12]AUR95087.1 hypothetical protein NVP1200O_67 [Vibrio phage 1.200.O._10N.286.55.E1]AUR99575.1 hypothetical protein NVP1267O_67 [Vibrio phage 1.267.O._10N.286.54.A1]AUR99660.1 hypothe
MIPDAPKVYIPYAPRERIVCGCGKGYASHFDRLCRFCRESLVRRAVARKVGVTHRGDGITIEQYLKAIEA